MKGEPQLGRPEMRENKTEVALETRTAGQVVPVDKKDGTGWARTMGI
ncbi:MAG: hypothetical protein RIC85_00585 [Gammaproteobacteria bacterium]